MPDQENQDIMPMLSQAFAAFNKSADKLGAFYGQLAAMADEQVSHDLAFDSHIRLLLLSALEYVDDGVIIVNHELRPLFFNAAARDLTGQSGSNEIDDPCLEILRDTLIASNPGTCRRRLSSGANVDINATPVMDDAGNIIGTVGILRRAGTEKAGDLSAIWSPANASAHNSLTPVFAAVGDIIINIAQRMRSPLSAIQLFAEILRQDLDTDKQLIVEDILIGVHSLNAVLSNLLSFAQPAQPLFGKVDLAEVLDESLTFAAPAIKQQSISLVKEYSQSSLWCRGDLEQLRQVCLNLILNAIQSMNDGGELSISASYIRADNSESYVNIDIKDTGCGIPDDTINRVFAPFFTTKEGAAGLGLCVVYRVIQAHEGTIQIDSSYSHGTTVSIQLPSEYGDGSL